MIVNLSPAYRRRLQARRAALLPSPASEKWRRKEFQPGLSAGVGFAPFGAPAKDAGIFEATNGAEDAQLLFLHALAGYSSFVPRKLPDRPVKIMLTASGGSAG
jgi:hypothetical protein